MTEERSFTAIKKDRTNNFREMKRGNEDAQK